MSNIHADGGFSNIHVENEELYPLLYQEILSPSFDAGVPDLSSGSSEEDFETLSAYIRNPKKQRKEILEGSTDLDTDVIQDFITNEEPDMPATVPEVNPLMDFSVFDNGFPDPEFPTADALQATTPVDDNEQTVIEFLWCHETLSN